VAQLVNAGCAALSYYTDMLFRSLAIFLIAGSVFITGCRAPQSGKSASSRPLPVSGSGSSGRVVRGSDGIDGPVSIASRDFGFNSADKNAIDAHAHFATGVIHEYDLEVEEALEEYYQAALLDPANTALVIDVAQQFLQTKQPERALALLSNAATNSAGSSGLFAELGFVYSKLGQTNQAVAADRAAIRKDPQSLAGYQSLFLEYLEEKQIAALATLLNDASKVKGTDADFLVGLAEMYFRFGKEAPAQRAQSDDRARAALERAVKLKPATLRLQLRLADGFNLLGRTADAARIYEEVLKTLPTTAPQYSAVRAKLADIYLRNHDAKHATEQLQAIARENPTDSQTYYVLGNIAYEETNFVTAADQFANAILFNPDFEAAYYNLATAQMGANRSTEALQTLERARRRFGQSFSGEYLAGEAFSHQKDYTNALRHLTNAEIVAQNGETNRLTDGFYFQIAAAYERTGDYAQAEKYFQNSLRLAPDSPETLNYLGYMWAEHGLKLDQSRDYITKALKSDPKNAAFLDSMAWVLFQLHQPKAALEFAQKALQYSEEEDATLYDHLGEIFNALGQKDKAQQAWKKSFAIEASEAVGKKMVPVGK